MMTNLIWLLAAMTIFGNSPDRKILYFRMASCPACKLTQPAIEELDAEGWEVHSVDIVQESKTAKRWGVAEIPTIIVVENGHEVERIVGSLDHAEIKRRVTGRDVSGRTEESPSGSSRKSSGTTDRSMIGANFPTKGSEVGPNYPSDSSILGPNHPSKRVLEDRDDPFALFGENHPAFYHKRKLQPRLPKSPATKGLGNKPTPSRAKNYLPSGVKLPELPETMKATVRIRIKTKDGESVGTGTVIYKNGDELLVLTCGHLFHESEEQKGMFVELFREGSVMQIPATLVDYRDDELDLGFIKFRRSISLPENAVPTIPILPKGKELHEQDLVFSIGCDGGDPPSRRDTVISRLNRFIGPSNIEIAGAPVQGRSGGGLFDIRGRLVGVCIAADNESDEGLFVGPEAIYGQLEKLGLSRLFE